VSVPIRSDATHYLKRGGLGCGPFFGLLDIRLAISESVDACQCCAESFLGDAERQLAFGALAG
jgi:hypothetical protein